MIIISKIIFSLAIITIFVFAATDSFSAVYYVSSNGNDNNDGLSQSSPWKTLEKVNSMMSIFTPGDRILFKKNETFSGALTLTEPGTAGNEIIFDSYGSGSNPKITGFKEITGWSNYSGNIYSANIADTVVNLYVNNKLMDIARYPNSGWLRVDTPNGKLGFHDAALNQTNGYWNGANCRIRTTNWCYETRSVSSFISGNILFSALSQYTTNSNYGYFLDNKLSLLDAENEWYYDIAAQKIYFYAPGGVNPNSIIINGVIYKTGFRANPGVSHVIIQNLTIEGYKDKGIDVPNGNYIRVNNCRIDKTDNGGIRIYGNNHILENNILEDNLNTGIIAYIFNGSIINNVINRTGLKPGYGENAWGCIGVSIESSTGTLMKNNIIDSSGYTGIRARGDNIVENNTVNYSCLTLNDGGAIAFDIADGLQLKNNIFNNTIANLESCPPNAYVLAYGIYLGDVNVKNVLITGNTVASNRSTGIYVSNNNLSDNFIITKNTLYNNFDFQIIFTDRVATSFKPAFNNTIKNNVFYCLNWKQFCMQQQMYKSTTQFSDYGVFDSNYYFNPYNELIIKRSFMPPNYVNKDYRLGKWKADLNEDLHSKTSDYSFDQFYATDTIGSNLITNPHFTSNLAPWTTWPSGSTITHTTHPQLDGGSMKIQWNGIGFTENFAISNSFQVTKDDYYLMSASCVGNHPGIFELWLRPSIPGVFVIGFQRNYGYENFRKDHSFIFKADSTDLNATFSTGMVLPDSLIYVDNLSLYKVNVERIDSTKLSKLFTNDTNIPKSFTLNGISYRDLDGNPITSSVTLPPYSSKILVNQNPSKTRELQLKLFIEGLYDANSKSMISDTVLVELRSSASPFNVIDSVRSKIDSSGNGFFHFTKANNGINYYLSVKHRNGLETWSSNPQAFNSDLLNYDFSVSAGRAYGNNQVKVNNLPNVFALYSGDHDRNGQIGLNDVINIFNDAGNFEQGYARSDLNGDLIVDLDDVLIAMNNSVKFIGKIVP